MAKESSNHYLRCNFARERENIQQSSLLYSWIFLYKNWSEVQRLFLDFFFFASITLGGRNHNVSSHEHLLMTSRAVGFVRRAICIAPDSPPLPWPYFHLLCSEDVSDTADCGPEPANSGYALKRVPFLMSAQLLPDSSLSSDGALQRVCNPHLSSSAVAPPPREQRKTKWAKRKSNILPLFSFLGLWSFAETLKKKKKKGGGEKKYWF